MSVCPADFRPLPKKKNTWSQVISTQQLKPMWFCDWHPQWTIDRITHFQNPCDWHFDSDTSGLNIPEDGKKNRVLGAASARLHPCFRREMVCFFIYSVLVKMNTTLSRSSHFVAKMYTYTCQYSFLLSLFVYQIYRNNETNYSFFRCFVNANTLPKLIVTQSWP